MLLLTGNDGEEYLDCGFRHAFGRLVKDCRRFPYYRAAMVLGCEEFKTAREQIMPVIARMKNEADGIKVNERKNETAVYFLNGSVLSLFPARDNVRGTRYHAIVVGNHITKAHYDMILSPMITRYGADPYQALMNIISDVNPAEIGAQIRDNRLQTWCRTVRTEAQKIIFSLIEKDRRLDGGDGGG